MASHTRVALLVSALALSGLGPTLGWAQGSTIVYGRLSNPWPQDPPPPWDDSGYPVPNRNGGLVLDLDADGQNDVGFSDNGTSFRIYGIGGTRVLTYPPVEPDINSFLPVLPANAVIGQTPPNPYLIWRETLYLEPFGEPYTATYNYSLNMGYGGYWQGREGYTGVEFNIAGRTHYAWIRVGAPFEGLHGGYIYDYAYETRANTPILAGAIPEPSSPVLLVLGGLGLLANGRRASMKRGCVGHAP